MDDVSNVIHVQGAGRKDVLQGLIVHMIVIGLPVA